MLLLDRQIQQLGSGSDDLLRAFVISCWAKVSDRVPLLTYPTNDSPCLLEPYLSGFIIPVISTLLGILVLHEPFAFQTAIGAVLVLGGVALTQRATGAT